MTTATDEALRLPEHGEAMHLAAEEYKPFVSLLRDLGPDEWTRATDCTLWDVRAVVAHNLANMEANASVLELIHQLHTANKQAKTSGDLMIDEMTRLQVAERSALTPEQMVSRTEAVVPRALKGRRRVPRVMRKLVRVSAPPPLTRMSLGYLIDHIYTRDVWMHRVDISRATGREMDLIGDHDRELVRTIVCDWAQAHDQSFRLVLEGPAGGVYSRGDGGEELQLDAVEFCRIVSGRNPDAAQGLLATAVLF
jgi:uncharacterized protein (TIGR03083 family)